VNKKSLYEREMEDDAFREAYISGRKEFEKEIENDTSRPIHIPPIHPDPDEESCTGTW